MDYRKDKKSPKIKQILALPTFPEQVDAFAELRGCFGPNRDSSPFATIKSHLAGEINISEAVNRIASSIEELFFTAEKGRALTSAPEAVKTENKSNSHDSLEGEFWDLWYSVAHAAKRLPWETESDQQEKLLELVKAIKARPNPVSPYKKEEIEDSWPGALTTTTLWSSLIMIGAAFRETWNDSPGGGSGLQPPEISAWANVNAFVARMVRDDVSNFWIYCIWAMRDGLENQQDDSMLDALVPAAVAWVMVLGKELYNKEEDLTPKEKNQGNPAMGGYWYGEKEIPGFNRKRWGVWKERFGVIGGLEGVSEETRRLAKMAFEEMERVEGGN